MKQINPNMLSVIITILVIISGIYILINRNSIQLIIEKPITEKSLNMKELFIAKLLPAIINENKKIIKERSRLFGIGDLKDLKRKYKTKDINELKKRINIIPVSIALAQAAIESGWGKSRFANEANNFYGQRSYNLQTLGIKPQNATGFVIIKYNSIQQSVGAYMLNLNTHKAYKKFRNARIKKEPITVLVASLTLYSEREKAYTEIIKSVILTNKFEMFDAYSF